MELLESFEYEETLNLDTRARTLIVLGTAVHQAERVPAIVTLEKTAFDASEASEVVKRARWGRLDQVIANDAYNNLLAWVAPDSERRPDAAVRIICPANEKHIRKYRAQRSRLVRETPEVYKDVVLPYINTLPSKSINWVYNILDGSAEAERVIHKDDDPSNGFIVLPDLKWDEKTMSALYVVAIVQTRKLKSLRDLRPAHLPLLTRIRKQAEEATCAKYGVRKGELRMFFHYQPTYYHLHIHIAHVDYVGFGGVAVGQAHLLDDVIDNLELEQRQGGAAVSYYEARTLTYALGTQHPLFERLRDAGVVEDAS